MSPSSSQPPTRLVHAAEHGNILIYYDKPATGVLDTLKRWAGIYDVQWSGIVVTPMSGLGEIIVLMACTSVTSTAAWQGHRRVWFTKLALMYYLMGEYDVNLPNAAR
ncbi:MAG: DUF3105 domain-containing protein [Proteobacteria bacterium]|nr:DUF3105 domain-containing protein [Pseudomonadota bacterium]